MARATSSLPVPLSPVIRTVELVGATARTISNSVAIAGETPITGRARGPGPTSRLEPDVLLAQAAVGERVAHDDPQLVDVERLQDVGFGAQLAGGDGRLGGAVRGHHHDRGLRRGGLDVAQDLDAVAVGQPHVGEHEVDGPGVERARRPRRGFLRCERRSPPSSA